MCIWIELCSLHTCAEYLSGLIWVKFSVCSFEVWLSRHSVSWTWSLDTCKQVISIAGNKQRWTWCVDADRKIAGMWGQLVNNRPSWAVRQMIADRWSPSRRRKQSGGSSDMVAIRWMWEQHDVRMSQWQTPPDRLMSVSCHGGLPLPQPTTKSWRPVNWWHEPVNRTNQMLPISTQQPTLQSRDYESAWIIFPNSVCRVLVDWQG